MHEYRLVQKQLADELGVDQSTISRWFSFDGESDFPASLTPVLAQRPQLKPLAIAILEFQADRMGYDLIKRVKHAELDGHLDDEMLEIVKHLGRVVEEFKTSGPGGYKKCRARIDAIIDAATRAKEELNSLTNVHSMKIVLGGTVKS